MSGMSMLFLAVAAAFVIWMLVKNRASASGQTYSNEESWDVKYNSDGLPVKIVIHRNAVRK